MKILHVVSSRRLWGAELLTVLAVQDQARCGHEPYLACRRGAPIAGAVAELASGVVEVRMKGWLGLAGWLAQRRLRSYITDHGIQVVHTNKAGDSLAAIPAARAAGVPSVTTVHGLGEKLYCAQADLVIAVSRAVAEDLISRGIDARKVEVVHIGVAVPQHAPSRLAVRNELGIAHDAPVVAMLAQLCPRKACDLLLDAAALLPEVQFLVAGCGTPSYERWLQLRARHLGVDGRVMFLGWRDDTDAVIVSADLVVLPSLSEGCPAVLLEAMALGVPVVASDVGGVSEIVENGVTGLLFRSGDIESMTVAIKQLLDDRTLRLRMGEAGRKRVRERFTVERMCGDLMEVYQGICDKETAS